MWPWVSPRSKGEVAQNPRSSGDTKITGESQRDPGCDDETVLQQIRAVTNSRATYGYRRVWAMVNRTFRASYNRKRIRRLMRMHGLRAEPRPGSRTRAMPRQTPPSTAA